MNAQARMLDDDSFEFALACACGSRPSQMRPKVEDSMLRLARIKAERARAQRRLTIFIYAHSTTIFTRSPGFSCSPWPSPLRMRKRSAGGRRAACGAASFPRCRRASPPPP